MFKVFQKLTRELYNTYGVNAHFRPTRTLRQILNYGISTCFKPHQTLRQLPVAPKDKTKVQEQSGVVYRIPCEECNKVNVGEHVKEHILLILRTISPGWQKNRSQARSG